ncbi:MAG: hypothetical protein EZS28_015136 [Streblomastix strix]|uniref:Uncharacterized protein n=1 Tax=Streblomastix strix TaxID=222440 RepID=A0A5J4W3C8_9EUKA|nr:MAG: hypothetical protein EZS28_015136 [Streblomastix strix]
MCNKENIHFPFCSDKDTPESVAEDYIKLLNLNEEFLPQLIDIIKSEVQKHQLDAEEEEKEKMKDKKQMEIQGSDADPMSYLLNYNPGQIKDVAIVCGQDELIELNRRIFSTVTKRYEMASKILFESLVDLTESGEKGDKLNQLRGSMLIQFRDLMNKQEEQLDELTSEIFKANIINITSINDNFDYWEYFIIKCGQLA